MALGLHFAQSFMPERKYLEKLLELFDRYDSMDSFLLDLDLHDSGEKTLFQLISSVTGIPTGASSGKVGPHIDYLRGMGLIYENADWYFLTPFGSILYKEDRFFDERISQLACHAMLCDKNQGALLYAKACELASKKGSVDKLHLLDSLGARPRVMSAFVSMYTSDSSFLKARIINITDDGMISLSEAPSSNEYTPLYGAIVAHLVRQYFPNGGQVSIPEFDKTTMFSARFGFSSEKLSVVFSRLAGAGYIQISSLINPPVFSMIIDEESAWKMLYSNLI